MSATFIYNPVKYLLLVMLAGMLMSFGPMKNAVDTPPDLPVIRKLLVTALESKKTTDSLYNSLGEIKERSALINAYMGTLEALKAKHAWNPYNKFKYLNDCEKTFKSAVTADPHNIEIRFMRFSIEHNVPKFLGYNKNLVVDRLEMVKQIDAKYYASADKVLVKTIIKFMLESKRCTADEQKRLHQHLAAL
ncbi:hypothetical protein [Mucilaginibacter psychrotolerans]|uniref:Uncharacterized protein n=1 Tax=Mucilaginibacter psychrotolerans TaxID=1524096 RepID=A0A4Y8SP27_9SPHI|nr:hypothetical protein [Mucilaginibacter psychrotolerans]TFF40698.1 hypothetical protein E2R66_00520 [Mucilaginibacter psychrotolerans]